MLKYYVIQILRKISLILRILPVQNRKILFYSYSGKNYSCSPKYLSEYISNQYPQRYQIVWAFDDPLKFDELSKKYILVKYGSLKFVWHHVTAGCIVTNTGTFKPIERRKNQLMINTWHGGGAYKKTGKDNPYKNKYQRLYAENLGQKDVNLFITSSEAFTKCCIKGAFGYHGEIMKCGLPRNDILVQNDMSRYRKKICSIYKIPFDTKIVLFAPTWRNYDMSSYENLNIKALLYNLTCRFGGDWVLFMRSHHFTEDHFISTSKVFNLTEYDDMQELLLVSDVLISDYSSCIWDYSLTFRPCFLFVPDLEKYLQTFDLYTPIEKWGMSVCKSNFELEKAIKGFNEENNIEQIKENHILFDNQETGKACKFICEKINRMKSIDCT